MENTNRLYTERVAILNQLIKKSSLTLDEALVFLSEEGLIQPFKTDYALAPVTINSSPTYHFSNSNVYTTTTVTSTPSTPTADLNN
jgi:hypothetical protein